MPHNTHNSLLYCGNNDKTPYGVYIIMSTDRKYCHITDCNYKEEIEVFSNRRSGPKSTTMVSRNCLDISGYNLSFFNYRENDKVEWRELTYKWNQSWILVETNIRNSSYIKDCNNNLYLCYGDNETKFLSKESPNRIILKKSY